EWSRWPIFPSGPTGHPWLPSSTPFLTSLSPPSLVLDIPGLRHTYSIHTCIVHTYDYVPPKHSRLPLRLALDAFLALHSFVHRCAGIPLPPLDVNFGLKITFHLVL
ncbi:hypothetical protein H103_05427, partial [Trichophyton rubrum CBS 288.86]